MPCEWLPLLGVNKFMNNFLEHCYNMEKIMNKLLQLGALFCCMLFSSAISAQQGCCPAPQAQACCDQVCDQPAGDAYRLYVHYEPCHYTTKRCVEECVPCTKKCYRKVPEYYQVERCRMVPEKYCETCCRYKTECYEVADTKTCKKWVCDQHCKYVPKYYWKHECEPVTACCPQGN